MFIFDTFCHRDHNKVGKDGKRTRRRGGFSYINYMHCRDGGVKANESEDMAREEMASLRPQTYRIQYIRGREGAPVE